MGGADSRVSPEKVGPGLWLDGACNTGPQEKGDSRDLDLTSLVHIPWPDPFGHELTMTPPGHILLLFLLPAVAAQMSTGSCSGCGPLSPLLLAGLVAADAVMSLIIVGVVFALAHPRPGRRPNRENDKVYINMPGRR
ncbi:hematopoietic cell signal transducer isoform X2 [Sciurus carolinensis]|uniref:hematopoietic cell signal transducer isoform X2 n=1 Tax=Sciurus carolinensis TaxID=30640 RepID=UPI001FB27ED6|nr:hematopoietic cell signal transducer isoform X2 [Sciurus carolinensis]